MKSSPDRRLMALLRGLSAVEAQNRLMAMTDREIALCMLYMSAGDRSFIGSLLAPAKARRIEEERRLHRRLAIRGDQYRKTVENVIVKVGGEGRAEGFRSYIRPRKR